MSDRGHTIHHNPNMMPMVDITAPEVGVEVLVDGDKVWINVDGQCVMRIYKAPEIEVQDRR